ncbi:MAG: hypothetical protein ACREBE_21980, partial [bacterium]
MSYYLRAFCTVGEPPEVGAVVRYAATRSSNLRVIEAARMNQGLFHAAQVWPASLGYKAGKSPIRVEVRQL